MEFNIGRIIFGLINPQLFLLKKEEQAQQRIESFNAQMGSTAANQTQQNIQQNQNPLAGLNNNNNQVQQNVQQNQNPLAGLNNNTNQVQQIVQQNQNPLAGLNNNTNQIQQNVQQNQNPLAGLNNNTNQVQQNIQQNQNPLAGLNNNTNQVQQNQNIKPTVTEQSGIKNISTNVNTETTNKSSNQESIRQSVENLIKITENPKMNNLTQTDRSVYVKNLLGLPQNLSDILKNAQNPNRPLAGGTLGLANLNQELLQNQKVLSELFQEINPNIQNTQELVNMLNTQTQTAQVKQDAIALIFSGMVSLPDISKLILQNSKQAVAALIIAMASASKKGIDSKQIQDTLKVINSCISMAESDNPAQNLKSLMMLYLPWLPLNEEIGFDLEITSPSGENDLNDSKLTVLIQTKNYGNLKGVFTLTTSNSVDIYIICSDTFPKDALQKSLMSESNAHAMNTNIDIEELKPIKEELNETRETKVNLSATNEMNPYLLLMAHSFIRHTIIIDNNA